MAVEVLAKLSSREPKDGGELALFDPYQLEQSKPYSR